MTNAVHTAAGLFTSTGIRSTNKCGTNFYIIENVSNNFHLPVPKKCVSVPHANTIWRSGSSFKVNTNPDPGIKNNIEKNGQLK
jgi:hypothetical protein